MASEFTPTITCRSSNLSLVPQPTPDPSSGESPLSLSTGRLQLPCVRRSADSPFQNRPCNGKGFAQGHGHSRHPPIPERKLLPSFDQSFAFPDVRERIPYPPKVRLNFRIGCDFSTANHSPLHLLGQVEPSRRTISPSESSGSPRLFSKLLSNLTPQLMHLNSRTVLAIPVSPVSAVGQGLRVINQKGDQQYERG